MNRINVTGPTGTDHFGEPTYGVVGWFDADKATRYLESRWWDGSNHISEATGTQFEHEALYRTAQGRWVLNTYSQWQGTPSTYTFVTDGAAREWLIAQNEDDAVEEHFGVLEDERGPGQPKIGGYVHIALGHDLVRQLDTWRGDTSRADAIRKAVHNLLTTTPS